MTIKAKGMEAVRIPVPYFLFGDREPFLGCIEELDKAFCWAKRYDLKVLIDLHTAPLRQNGLDGEVESRVSDEEKRNIYRELAEVQLDAWNSGSGYFYWSYKLLTDTVNDPGWIGWDSWDFGRCADFGWFPEV